MPKLRAPRAIAPALTQAPPSRRTKLASHVTQLTRFLLGMRDDEREPGRASARSLVMTTSNPHVSRSCPRPVIEKGEFALRAATALLMTFAAALVLIRASALGGVVVSTLDAFPLPY